jgi:hypothetical protein
MTEVLSEAYGNVQRGLVTTEDFRAFSFENAVRFYSTLNPRFFDGTRVAGEAAKVIADNQAEIAARLASKAA